jgi:glycoside/pentoside/hexuronide:cation symporter, GPH family
MIKRDVLSMEPSLAETTARARTVDPRTKILYGIGGVVESIKSILFALFTLYFYTTVMGLPGTLVGIATAIGLLWDAIIDPYIGHLSDRSRSRFGRRHSFMLAGSVVMGLSFWAFFSPPQGLSTPALFTWLLVSSLLVRTLTSVYGIPYYALGAELSHDYHERSSITAVRGLIGLLGTLGAAAFSLLVFFPERAPGVDPKFFYEGYPAMGLTFGIVITIAGLVATAGTLQWRTTSGSDPVESENQPGEFFRGFVQSLKVPSFRIFFISFSLFFLAVVTNQVLAVHFFTYYLQITASAQVSAFQIAFYLGGAAGLFFWLALSRRVEKHWLYMVAAVCTGILMLSAILLLGEGRPFGTGNPLPVVVGHALAGLFGSVIWFLPASMVADVADEDELETGKRREGSFFGIYFFGQQLAAGVSLLLTGVLLDHFAGLAPGQIEQTAETARRIGILFSVLPAALVFIAAASILRYSLGRRRLASIQAELAQRRLTNG